MNKIIADTDTSSQLYRQCDRMDYDNKVTHIVDRRQLRNAENLANGSGCEDFDEPTP